MLGGLDGDEIDEHLLVAGEGGCLVGARNHVGITDAAVALGDGVIHAVGFQIVVKMGIAAETSREPAFAASREVPFDAFHFACFRRDEILHDLNGDFLSFRLRVREAFPMANGNLDAEMLHDDSRPAFRKRGQSIGEEIQLCN